MTTVLFAQTQYYLKRWGTKEAFYSDRLLPQDCMIIPVMGINYANKITH